jgi:1,4-alpha-glucan branching enzyme
MAHAETIPQERDSRRDIDLTEPVSIYQVHPGSWMRVPEENNRILTEQEIAPKLADYAQHMGFTHVELVDAPESTYVKDYLDQQGPGVIGSSGFPWDTNFTRNIRGYFAQPPAQRKLHHQWLKFRPGNCSLRLSHEEHSLLANMPGDEWQKFANLRLLLAYMYLQPGKKLLFMGHEFGQWRQWDPETSLDWHLLQFRYHRGTQELVKRLNDLYRHERALQGAAESFEWIDGEDAERSTVSWLRWDAEFEEVFLAVFNFTPAVHRNFKVGVPRGGEWRELINTDAQEYGGSGQGNFGSVRAAPFGWEGRPQSLLITVPPLAAVAFKNQKGN